MNRGVSLRDNRTRVLIQDEVETSRAVELVWAMHTEAAVEVQGDRALLTQGGAVLEARLLSPAGTTFTLEAVEIPPPQQPATDVSRLLVRLPGTTSAQIAVLFTPRRSLSAATTGTVTGTATFPASGTTAPGSSFPSSFPRCHRCRRYRVAAPGRADPPGQPRREPAAPGDRQPEPLGQRRRPGR